MTCNSNQGFIVCDGYNTSYISSLLFALFYIPSNLDNILENACDPDKMYLQDIIKINFVNNVRLHISITEEILNEIRNYSHYCGWLKIIELLTMANVCDYYIFLAHAFKIKPIELKNNCDLCNVIKLRLKNKSHNVHDLFYSWAEKNIIINAPQIIALQIDRTRQKKCTVDIKKFIQPHKYNTDQKYSNIVWEIQSIICFDNIYYSLITFCNKWYLFNEKNIPAVHEIDIKNKNIMETTQKNCVLLIYNMKID